MRPASMEERAWLEGQGHPYAQIFEYLKKNQGWQHLDLSELPGGGGPEEKKQALENEAGNQGLVLEVKVRPGNPAGGIFAMLLHGK
jgi:hypothetical protein